MNFKALLTIGAVLAAVVVTAQVPASAAKKCVLAGGEGVGISPEIATDLSKIALGDAIKKLGSKADGKVSTKCVTNLVVTNCVSSQKACK